MENLFDSAKAMNLDTWAEGRPVLEKFAALNALLGEIDYTPGRKQRMVQLLIRVWSVGAKQVSGQQPTDTFRTGPFVEGFVDLADLFDPDALACWYCLTRRLCEEAFRSALRDTSKNH
jgi:hypothetical protein